MDSLCNSARVEGVLNTCEAVWKPQPGIGTDRRLHIAQMCYVSLFCTVAEFGLLLAFSGGVT